LNEKSDDDDEPTLEEILKGGFFTDWNKKQTKTGLTIKTKGHKTPLQNSTDRYLSKPRPVS